MEILQKAKVHERPVSILLKSNPEFEYEGRVLDVMDNLVALQDPDQEQELRSYILLDEIAAVGVLKGEDD